jgi:pyruvate/2-oxoglutarate dehydrogenase complex dihydrolipoamide acyltransferase (E2) component
MEQSELSRLLEFGNIRKQRELTPEEIKEGFRLFKKGMLEPDTQPLKTHTGENEFTRAQTQEMRRRYEQHMPDSPAKTRMLRLWELADTNTYERKLTAEERAEMLKLVMEPMMEAHPELAAMIRESDEDQIAS